MGKIERCCEGKCLEIAPHLRCRECREALARARMKSLRRRALPPESCGPEMPVALARGAMVVEPVREVFIRADGRIADQHAGYRGRDAARRRDVFDQMMEQQARAKGTTWLTVMMVGAGRAYRDLFEAVQCAGVKCSADLGGAGGAGGGFMDAYMRDVERIERFWAAIGRSDAKRPRRARVVRDADLAALDRRIITVRALVDAVCIAEKPLSAVLSDHGWTVSGKNREALNVALSGALLRMQGI